jgi:Chloroplast import apparatus Tic20-like
MTWRGTTSPQDRALACLPYALPLLESLVLGIPLLTQFIPIQVLFPLLPLVGLTSGWMGLIIFFALYFGVVRNENINHFIRFNTMQALLISIALSLFQLIFGLLAFNGMIAQTLNTTMFLGAVIASVYSLIQTALGRYAEIPTLSEAVYMQVR